MKFCENVPSKSKDCGGGCGVGGGGCDERENGRNDESGVEAEAEGEREESGMFACVDVRIEGIRCDREGGSSRRSKRSRGEREAMMMMGPESRGPGKERGRRVQAHTHRRRDARSTGGDCSCS